MENKGCITCRKCEQVRSNFFCGRTRLSQKQLYNKHGFCSDYEPKEQIEKPMTNEEWFNGLSTEEKAKWIATQCGNAVMESTYDVSQLRKKMYWLDWLKEKHNGV